MARDRTRTEIINDEEDLCIFGYEVKFFKINDSTNQEGPHMITLPYDEEIEVDRYDCRLLLHSLKDIGQVQSEHEVDFEEEYLCEEERYLDLKSLESHEKQVKVNKSSKGAAAIPYAYEAHSPSPSNSNANSAPDEPFKPPKGQYYPSGMILPTTKKHALLIEKTAKFVVEKGAEFELSISSKASSNKNLSFLLPNDSLNCYYKYVLSLIKDKIYTAIPLHEEQEDVKDESGSDEEYLSPLLLRKRKQHPAPNIPQPPKKISKNMSIVQSTKENDSIQPKLYFEWHHRFYNGPSPYYPNILPKIIKPPEQQAAIIRAQAELVAKNGRTQEKLLADNATDTKHLHFTNPYYMFYQSHLYKKAVEIENVVKEQERQKAAKEEGEIVDEALEDTVISDDEIRLQMERRAKAHLFLKTILNQKREQKPT